jgi:hypothetical protein
VCTSLRLERVGGNQVVGMAMTIMEGRMMMEVITMTSSTMITVAIVVMTTEMHGIGVRVHRLAGIQTNRRMVWLGKARTMDLGMTTIHALGTMTIKCGEKQGREALVLVTVFSWTFKAL